MAGPPQNPTVFSACVVIPVYDHEHAIAAVVDAVRAHGLPLVLVDDGCSPACRRELERLAVAPQVTLLRHDRNRGKGAAVVSGLRAARSMCHTHAVQIDADGQHELNDLPRFIDEARAHPQAVVCGRPVFDASIPRSRFYGRYITHALVWLQTLSFEIADSMCGFRVYPLAATLVLLDTQRVGARMDFDTEILVRLVWRRTPTRWLATRVRYPADGVSHYRMLFDNVRMASLHARLLCGMLLRLPLLLRRRFARPTGARQAHKRGLRA